VNERRKNDRIDAYDVGLAVVNGIDDEHLGIVGNLSQGGMMLITTRQLYSDGFLQLKIKAPAELGCKPISMGVKVLWCTPANSPNEYWAGVETIDMSTVDREALQCVLDHLSDTV
jgi:hypothetical protein